MHTAIVIAIADLRVRGIQDIVNYRLFPFLVAHGYKLDGYEFRFYGLKDKKENTVDNKSYDEPNPAKRNNPDEDRAIGFFGKARKVKV